FFLLIFEIFFGIIIFDFLDKNKKFNIFEKLLSFVAIGIILSNFIILLFSLIFKSLDKGILFFLFIFLVFYIFNFKKLIFTFKEIISYLSLYFKNKKWSLKENFYLIFLLIFILVYSYILFNFLSSDENNDLLAFYPMAWGDNAFHISLIQYFKNNNNFNLNHPLINGYKLSYHFMIDFISAVFYRLNNNLLFSFRLPMFLFSLISVLLLFRFSSNILKSKNWALISIILIFLGSGMGFLLFFNESKEIIQSQGIASFFDFLMSSEQTYTQIENLNGSVLNNIQWIVPLISFFTHQRSFSLGFCLFLIILLSIYYYGKDYNFWRFGLIAGLLPFSHVHTFFSLFIIMSVLLFLNFKNIKEWLKFATFTFLVSFPQLIYLKNLKNFSIKLNFGWTFCSHNNSWFFCDDLNKNLIDVFFYWFKNFGIVFLVWLLFIILFLLTFIFKKNKIKSFFKGKNNLGFFVASIFLFIIPNLFLFQPWNFDNNKILFYWWFLSIIFIILPLFQSLWNLSFSFKFLIIILLIFSTFSGFIDVSKIIILRDRSFYYADKNKENEKAVNWIKNFTEDNALFLTSSDIDAPPIFMAGRRIYLGYEGWIFSEGLDYF
ncbi:MAG TPA: hypothetical protein PK130_01910, partial [Candidatus Pacearchaeota archaeon]|nr:hypothetical protein [Candidatus Pacearchaeota archaeon]